MSFWSHIQDLSLNEKLARLRLIRTPTVGPTSFRQWLSTYGSAQLALEKIPNLPRIRNRKTKLILPSMEKIKAEWNSLEKHGVNAVFLGEKKYPRRLAVLEDSPPILFVKGYSGLLDSDCIGVVGSRNASAAGIKMAHWLSKGLCDAGIIIASGMARGIDTAAHQASLHGGSIACLAGGVDNIYPKENTDLYHDIIETGAVISEMPLFTKPQARHFPRRNRIISGLSLGLLVIEAAEKSGSLITARLAGEQGREVFAVPGSPLDPRTKGTNQLIKEGACLVESVADILIEIETLRHKPLQEPAPHMTLPLSTDLPEDQDGHEVILSLLGPTSVSVDDIIRMSHLSAGQVAACLLVLELSGEIIRYPGNKVARLENEPMEQLL